MNVVVSEYLDEAAIERLRTQAEVVYDAELHASGEALERVLGEADALVVRNQTVVNGALLDRAPRLQAVGRVGVGLDNLDLAALRARDVVVTWAQGANAVSVAEYVIGGILALGRKYAQTSALLHQGEWNRRDAMGEEIFEKTLGIVGLGDIGARLARRARALGLDVVASDPVVHENTYAVQELGVQQVDLDELLTVSDFVSLHVPLLESTRDLIDRAALAKMKPGAILVNTARGGLVDEEALADALARSAIGGAVLDVRRSEPPGEADPLRGLPNVILTPHVAGVTREALRRASLHVAEDVLRVLRGERPKSAVPL